jgi:hypothetical protein
MAIGPDKWGVHGWKFIHHIALGYPIEPNDNDKNNYKSFFMLLGNVLPCHICSDHYNEHLLIHPLNDEVLSTKMNFINWTIDMHNEVNKKNGTKIYGYDEALKLIRNNYQMIESYENVSSNKKLLDNSNKSNIKSSKPITKKSKSNNTMLYIGIIIFLILLVIAVIYKRK